MCRYVGSVRAKVQAVDLPYNFPGFFHAKVQAVDLRARGGTSKKTFCVNFYPKYVTLRKFPRLSYCSGGGFIVSCKLNFAG